jgi:putative endonuclease
MYFVYILKCADGSLYTGITTDLGRRLAEHKGGRGARYTGAKGAIKFVYTEQQPDRSAASKREAQIKSWPREKKVDLIGMKKSTETVAGYIAAAPAWAKPMVRELRATIKAAAPKAKESISYHMPYYSHEGRLAYIGVAKQHVGFFWIGGGDKKTFAKELAPLHVVGSTLRILQGEKVPKAVIKKLVKARVKENKARAKAKAKTKKK